MTIPCGGPAKRLLPVSWPQPSWSVEGMSQKPHGYNFYVIVPYHHRKRSFFCSVLYSCGDEIIPFVRQKHIKKKRFDIAAEFAIKLAWYEGQQLGSLSKSEWLSLMGLTFYGRCKKISILMSTDLRWRRLFLMRLYCIICEHRAWATEKSAFTKSDGL